MARLRLGLAGVLFLVLLSGLLGPSALRAPAFAADVGAIGLDISDADAPPTRDQDSLASLFDPWDDPDDEASGRAKDGLATSIRAPSWSRSSCAAVAAPRRPCPPSTGPPAPRAG